MFEPVPNAPAYSPWHVIELRLLRNRVANLYELNGEDRETAETLAFLLDFDGLNAAVAHLSNKRIIMMGVQDGKAMWTEENV